MSDLPRVTTILNDVGLGPDLSKIPPALLEAGRARGSAVHAAREALVYGYENEELLNPVVAPYLDAYKKFVAESGYVTIRAEFEVVSRRWRYRGHPDDLGWLQSKRMIVDIKTGTDEGVAYQLVAYRVAWNEEHPDEPVEALAAVQLRADGTYRFNEVSAVEAEPVWFAAVTVFYAKRRTA